MTEVLQSLTPLLSPDHPIEVRRTESKEDQLSLLALLVAVLRKSLVGCRTEDREKLHRSMEIGLPTDVRHVAHVTFDRFHGFLGLPVEFEPEVPRRAPSASATVFGVSTESMQCSYDSRGNSVPTILLLMQRHLYTNGGLQVCYHLWRRATFLFCCIVIILMFYRAYKYRLHMQAEGIFRINAENSQEEIVRDQLNNGVVPDGIDVHCMAGLIKAWFRELPSGVLDSLSPEQVMQCQTEEECAKLVKLLPPADAALLDWAINLMADVVQEEHLNKMNARNVAMVFAPNMTQMDDPLTALMYAVQVMNFLKTLIIRTLKERQNSVVETGTATHSESDENDHEKPSQSTLEAPREDETEQVFSVEEPVLDGPSDLSEDVSTNPLHAVPSTNKADKTEAKSNPSRKKAGQFSSSNHRRGSRKCNNRQSSVRVATPAEKSKGISIISRINARMERVEAWR
ncbi:hypothetical protein QJS10_CPB13g01561 [Acorus calamus]|uniref:Uncharacterized protein n=1 Tax=Acorus calamus TaxID=4465 RepID=A0AAV9DFN5_ACOCL|nr:hypothetical protein QJS10_CPB13g01561 [Acorus calamus]